MFRGYVRVCLSILVFVWLIFSNPRNDSLRSRNNTCKFVYLIIPALLQDIQWDDLLSGLFSSAPDLAVSFHSASLPSFTQISSNSVNSSWETCSASSSAPRMNWTRWDGVSNGDTGCERSRERWRVVYLCPYLYLQQLYVHFHTQTEIYPAD